MLGQRYIGRSLTRLQKTNRNHQFNSLKYQYSAMLTRLSPWVFCLLITVTSTCRCEEIIKFGRDIQPILANHCYTCHGPDQNTRQSGLRLDQRDVATSPSDSRETAIIPGKPEESELYRRLTSSDHDLRMPPAEQGSQPNQRQIELIKNWIEQGAQYERHWSFLPVRKPSVPKVADLKWVRNPIDAFVAQKLNQKGLTHSTEASRETLIRRVSFDLTGLPPSIAEVDLYLNDPSADAYERMVDRYMHTPAYGEHLAKHWLDLARYADTNGYQYDTEREQWAWRDWVIHAYTQNMPFDQFTAEQLAGDLLRDGNSRTRLATGFNRNHGITIEGGIIDEEYRTEYVMDRVVTTGSVWMGLTIGCARCHDHKYDPISQKEFYELYAFFNQVPERGMRGFAPQERIPSPFATKQTSQLQEKIGRLKEEIQQPVEINALIENWAESFSSNPPDTWLLLKPKSMTSSGGSTLSELDDQSILVGGANPSHDIYTITAHTNATELRAVRIEALTHPSLPGGGPGRHTNSNFVLSEFEAIAVSATNPNESKKIHFKRALADYSQAGYEVAKTIDGTVANNSGWAVDGPTRKEPATAILIAEESFGFEGGTLLQFKLKHQANFSTHGIGRVRLSVTTDPRDTYDLISVPSDITNIAKKNKAARSESERQSLEDFYTKHFDPKASLRTQLDSTEKELATLVPATMVMADLTQQRKTHLLLRGQYNQPGEEVHVGIPEVFDYQINQPLSNRLDFANWITGRDHPLTARVAVNRHWQRLLGRGIVKTSEDFGRQGDLPSHPELLDWLAISFIEKDWDVKALQRLILTSSTYRQTSHGTTDDYLRDPENTWLSRGPRFRLDGEQIRDAALASSGLLASQIGGRSVFPYQPAGLWMELNNRPGYSKAYPQSSGIGLVRRSLYSFWKRTVPSPMLKTLDVPEREFCTIRRSRTNTPLQALLLLNGTQFMEAAQFLGARMMLETEGSIEDKIRYGFRLVTSRVPTEPEMQILMEEFTESQQEMVEGTQAAIHHGNLVPLLEELPLDAAQLKGMTSVARLLLNLDETITKS